MSKKLAISIAVAVMAVVYLFLLVAVPALEDMVPVCGNLTSEETDNNSAISYITANWTPIGPEIDVRPYREIYKAPLLLYLVPGLVFLAILIVALKQKRRQNR